MILRLRLGFEAVRRELANADGEWWPYAEAIHSNVPEFNLRGATERLASGDVIAGDLVIFDVVGVNPIGPQEDLRYKWQINPIPGDSGWLESNHIEVTVPSRRRVVIVISLTSLNDEENAEQYSFVCNIQVRAGES